MNNSSSIYQRSPWNEPADQLRVVLDRAQREHDLLMERTNMFLLYHSILMAGFALGNNAPAIVACLPVLGVITSFVWLYVGQRSLMTASYFWNRVLDFESQCEPSQRIFTDFFEWRSRTRFPVVGFSVAVYVGRVLPALWACTWILAAFLFYRRN